MKIEELNDLSTKNIEDFDEINKETLKEIQKKKEEFDKKYKKVQQRVIDEMLTNGMYKKFLGYIPESENPNKRKPISKAKKAKKRRIKRQSKRRNRR